MDLSVALIIAASFAILCTFYIGKRILTIDFSEYSSKNSKKAKLERLLAKKETPLQNSKIRRDMRNAFERILIPLGNENDEDLLDFSVGTIKLLKVAHTEETTTVTADIFGTKTFLPENQKPYTEKFKKRLLMQRARYPEKRKTDGEFFTEKDCPSCGANFMPDENHCCSFCGYGLQVNNAKWIVQKN